MKSQTRFLAVLTALLTLLPLSSCGGSNPEAAELTSEQNEVTTEAETSTTAYSAVPDELDYDGATVNFLDGICFTGDYFYLSVTEETGDIVSDAVYKRNLDVMQDLNVSFAYVSKNKENGDSIANAISNSVLAADDAYDIIFGIQYDTVPLVLQKMFTNLNGAPYIDTSREWWSSYYISEMTVGNSQTYFLSGDITLGLIRQLGCVFYDKTLYQNLYGSPDDMYDLVFDGKWTMEQLSDYSKDAYADLNGNSEYDEDDRYGGGVITASLADQFMYSQGLRVTERDADGIPRLAINNEHSVKVLENMIDYYYNNPGVHIYASTLDVLFNQLPAKFKNHELAFMFGWFYITDYLRDMEDDYGIIPFPKFDETQEDYLSLIFDCTTVVCVPVTCSKLDMVGAVMEDMAYEGYNTVYPAYYEVALKVKYIRDGSEAAVKMVDLIHDSATTDFAFIYNYALNSIGTIDRDVVSSSSGTFASTYAKKEEKTKTMLDDLVSLYLAE